MVPRAPRLKYGPEQAIVHIARITSASARLSKRTLFERSRSVGYASLWLKSFIVGRAPAQAIMLRINNNAAFIVDIVVCFSKTSWIRMWEYFQDAILNDICSISAVCLNSFGSVGFFFSFLSYRYMNSTNQCLHIDDSHFLTKSIPREWFSSLWLVISI